MAYSTLRVADSSALIKVVFACILLKNRLDYKQKCNSEGFSHGI